jgi:ketosteroid isomerase-like protein
MDANVDLVRAIFAAWERGDWSSAGWAHPEIEFVVVDGPTPASSTGLAAMADYWRDFLRAWEGYRVQADEYRTLDEARVLVLLHIVGGRGKASGMDLGQIVQSGANVFHIRHGKVTRFVVYFEGRRALAELGLEE